MADQHTTGKLKITHWVLRGAVAFVFVSSGLEKFSIGPGAEWVKMFARIGWGDWFRYLTGGLEVAGGVLLMVPALVTIGAGILIACMGGAIMAHVLKLGDPFSSIINVLLIAAIVAAARKPTPESEEMTRLELTTENTKNTELR